MLTAQGPVPGPSVNIVSSDPFLQKQVEVDAGANPLNPSHILAGFIDYQTVVNEDPSKSPTSSAWCGYSFSTNGGKTWKNGRIPGFPGDASAWGTGSPIRGSTKCGDPVVTWDASGHVYFMGLAVLPNEVTSLFVARFTDPDDGSGTLAYDFTRIIDNGNPSSAGQVLDKPSILFVPDDGSTDPAKGTLYACGSIFDGTIGSNFRTKVVCGLSTDAGNTYTKANQGKVNGTINTNNGTWMAPAPGGSAYLFWRSFLGAESGYWFVKIAPNGSATAPRQAVGPLGFYPYDAPTLGGDPAYPDRYLARTNAFPTVATDGAGRILLAFQAYLGTDRRMGPPSDLGPRIFLAYSSDGGTSWSVPLAIDPGPAGALQFMPSLAAGGGGIFQVLYYDGRNDGRPATQVDVAYLPIGKDRRFDLRVWQGRFNPITGALESAGSVQVNQYKLSQGQIMDRLGCASGTCPAYLFPNLPIAAGGTKPFVGDYIALVPSVQWVRNPPGSSSAWRAAKGTDDPSAFYAFWVSTEDVAFPLNPATGRPDINADWTQFVPAGDPPTNCVNPKTRDSNVYFATISPGLTATWRGTSRPLAGGVSPQFTVTVENRSGGDADFSLTIRETDLAEDWSFRPTPPAGTPPPDQNTIVVRILARSGISLPVYYRTRPILSPPAAPVEVVVEQIGGSGLKTRTTYTTSLQLNNLQLNNLQLNNLQLNNLQLNNLQLNNLQLNNISPSNLQLNNLQLNNLQLNNLQLNNLQLNNLQLNNSLVPDQDATWTVTGTGGVATSGNAITSVLNGQELLNAGNQFQLMIYQTQMNPGVAGCASVLLPTDTILANIAITNPNAVNSQVNNLQLNNLQLNNLQLNNTAFDDPQVTNATFAVASDDEVKITLRSFKPGSAPARTAALQNAASGLGSLSSPVNCAANPVECDRFGEAPFSAFNPDGTQVIPFNDSTPPVIVPTVTGTRGANGWYVSSVTVIWRVADPQSGIAASTGCAPATLTADTTGATLTCWAKNGKGLTNEVSVTVKIDQTPPVVTPAVAGTLGANGWYVSDVTVSWDVTDPVSGVASTCAPTTLTQDTTGTKVECSATNGAGLTGTNAVTIKLDRTPPPVPTITSPADLAGLLLNAVVAASYDCGTDATSGLASCAGPVLSGASIPTNLLGERVFKVTATDKAGNTASAERRYWVLYLLLPTAPKSPARLGSAVPLTWQLKDGKGLTISDLTTLITLRAIYNGPAPASGLCAPSLTGGETMLFSPATGATGKSDYRFLSSTNSFRFNWDTTVGRGKGCYTLLFQLTGDPPPPGFAGLTPPPPRTTTVQLN